MNAKALYVIAIIATLQFNMADYCWESYSNKYYYISDQSTTNIPCLVAMSKLPDDPPRNDYSFPYVSNGSVSVSGTVSTASEYSTNIVSV